MNLLVAETIAQIAFCREALFAFRPNLHETTYLDTILRMMAEERFKLAYIPDEQQTRAVAFVGYRLLQTLRTDWMIYVDDLYTDPAYRGRGYASALLDYIDQQSQSAQIPSIHLDSGYDLYDAHRLYFRKGYVLVCNHFAKNTSMDEETCEAR